MSKQIDERVVSMQFDNEDFEKKVSQTQSSIKKLNESLNSADGAKISDGLLRIGDTLDKLNAKFSAAGVAIGTVVSKITSGVMDSVSKLSGFAIDSVLTGGKNRALNLQKATFAMEGVLDTAEEVKAVMDDVDYGVKDTAYSLDAAATVASQLVATGIRAGDEMRTVLRGISGVSAQTSSDYSEIGHIFTTIAGQGKVTAMQLSQLAIRGMNASATLAEYFRKTGLMANATEADIREMVSQGKIDFKTFAAAMDDAFGEHAYKANETFTGVMSNIKSAFAKIGAIFATPLFENQGSLVKFLDSIRALINDFKSTLAPLENVFRALLDNVLSPITSAFNSIHTYFTKFDDLKEKVTSFYDAFEQYQGLIDEIWAGKWDNMYDRWNKLAEAGYELSEINWIQHLVNASEGIEDHRVALADLTDEQLREIYFTEEEITAFRELQSQCHETGEEFTDVLARMEEYSKYGGDLKTIFSNSFYKLGQGLRVVLEGIAQAFREIFGGDIVTKLYDMGVKFAELTDKIAYYDEAIGDVVITEKFAKLVENITSIFKVLLSVIKVVFTVISTAGRIAFSIFKKIFGVLIKGLASADLNGFADSVSEICNNIVDWIDNNATLNSIIDFLGTALSTVVGWIKSAIKYVKESGTIQTIISGIGSVLSIVIGYISKIIDFVKENNLIQRAFSTIATVISTIAEYVKNIIGQVKESSTIQTIISGISTVLSTVIGYVSKIINFVKEHELIQKAFSAIASVISTVVTVLVNAFTALHNWYTESETAQRVVQSLKDGFVKMVEIITTLIDKFKTWFSGLKDGTVTLKDIFDEIKAWFTGKIDSFKEDGGNFVQGFINGFKEKAGDIWSVITEIASKIISKFREILGIQSPSTETYSDGTNFIQGFINAISDFAGKAFTSVKDFGKGIVKAFGDIDWGAIGGAATILGVLAGTIAIIVGITKKVKKVTSVIQTYTSSVMNFIDGVGTFLKNGGKLGKAKEKNTFADNMKAIALVIASLSIAIFAIVNAMEKIAKMDDAGFKRASRTMIVIAAVILVLLVGTAFLSSKFSEMQGSLEALTKVIKAITKIATAFLILSLAFLIISTISQDKMFNALVVFGSFTLLIGAILICANSLKSGTIEKIDALSIFMISLGAVFVALAISMAIIGTMKPSRLATALGVVGLLAILVVALLAVSQHIKDNKLTSLSVFMLSISAVFLALAGSMWIIGQLKPAQMTSALIAISLLGLMIMALLAIINKMDAKDVTSLAWLMLSISACFITLALSLRIIGGMKPAALIKGLTAIVILGLIIGGLIYATKQASSGDIGKAALVILAVAALMLVLGTLLVIFQFLNPAKLAIGTACIAVLIGMIALLVYATGKSKECLSTLIVLTVLVAILSGVLIALSTMDPKQVLPAAAAMTALIGVLSLLVFVTKFAGEDAMAPLIVIAALVAILGLIIIGIIAINPEAGIAVCNSLTVLLLGLSVALVACAVAGSLGMAAFIGIAAIAVLIVALTAVFAALGALVLFVDQQFGEGTAANVLDNAIMVMQKLGEGIGTFFAAIITTVSDAIISIIPAIGQALTDFMNNASGFIEGAKKIDSSVLVGVGILALAIAAIAAAEMIESIMSFLSGGDVITKFATQLPILGLGLSLFSTTIQDIDLAKVLVASTAIGILANAAANIPATGGLVNLLTGSKDIAAFADQFEILGQGLNKFNNVVKDIEFTDSTEKAIEYAGKIAEMSKKIPNSGGWLGKIVGENDLGPFADQFPKLGEGLAAFNEKVSGVEFTENTTKAIEIATSIAEMAKKIPNSGGWLGKIVGDNDLGPFAEQFPKLGEGLVGFNEQIASTEFSANIDQAMNIAASLVELSDKIPNEGGWISKIIGDNKLSDFADQFPKLGEGLAGFSDAIKGKQLNQGSTRALEITREIVNIANDIPNGGASVASFFAGDNDLEDFANKFPALGRGIAGFADEVSGSSIDETKMENALSYLRNIAYTFNYVKDIDTNKVKNFFNLEFSNFGKKLVEFNDYLAGIDWHLASLEVLRVFIEKLTSISNLASGADSSGFGNLTSIADALADVTALNSFLTNFNDTSTAPQDITDTVNVLVDNFVKALEDGLTNGQVSAPFDTALRNAKDAISYRYNDFYNAGYNVVMGLANGISNYSYLAVDAARSMTQDTLNTITSTAQERSPSKLTYLYGRYMPEGMANGITKYGYLAANAAADVTQDTIDAFSDSTARIASIINSDIDTNPTITPVLDLSNVTSGAQRLNSILAMGSSIGMSASAQITAARMANRQNGNYDIVSAIHSLEGNLERPTTNSYNIDGITYDDGSAIGNAIGDLIGAIRMERRM